MKNYKKINDIADAGISACELVFVILFVLPIASCVSSCG